MTEIHDVIDLYTDGACKNLGLNSTEPIKTFGAWAYVVIINNKVVRFDSQAYNDTTNNRMELAAVIEGLKYISEIRAFNQRVVIHTDSAYVCNCYLQKWYEKWMRNGWISSTKTPVKNKDLWEKLIPFFENTLYRVTKVEGHSTDQYNNMCDKLCSDAALKAKQNWQGEKNVKYEQDYI